MTTYEAAVQIAGHIGGAMLASISQRNLDRVIDREKWEGVHSKGVAAVSWAIAKELAHLAVEDDHRQQEALGPLPEPRGAR